MTGSPWQSLGIAPTDDESAIRRAYSARLKTIDVDSDPDAFIALRAAFDAVQRLTAQTRYAAREALFRQESEAQVLEPTVEALDEPDIAPVAKPQWLEDIEGLQTLIYGNQSREAIFSEVGERMERLVASPEMESVDHAAKVERWAAETILRGIPRTNGMLAPAINGFGWLKLAGRWDCPPLVTAVLNRYSDCEYVARLHPVYVRVLNRLKDPADKPGRRDREFVEHLLTEIRSLHPTILRELCPGTVDAWDGLFERRRNALPARATRWVKRLWERLHINEALRILWFGFIGLVLVGLAFSTGGVALIWIVPMVIRRMKRA